MNTLYLLQRRNTVKQQSQLTEMIFNLLKDILRLWPVNKIDGESSFTEPSSPSNSVKVSLAICPSKLIHWKIVVNDDGYLFHINT